MTDLHTHILPRMDDGSRSVEESLQLLALEREQGVRTVCLTPHFYPEREDPRSFLRRRQASWEALQAALPVDETLPTLRLGAEVAWYPTLHQSEELERLCLGDSRYFLLELPFQPWSPRLMDNLYQLPDLTGLTPILAHVERYAPIQGRKRMKELFQMGLPMQMNASQVLYSRRKALSFLKKGEWFLASDCHDLTHRPPELGPAAQFLREKLGPAAEDLLHGPVPNL